MDFLRVALALGTVFGLLGLVYFLSNRARTRIALEAVRARASWPARFRTAQRPDPDYLQVLRRVSLTPTHQLHLIASRQKLILLCTHPRGCTLLPAPAASPESRPGNAAPEECERYAS